VTYEDCRNPAQGMSDELKTCWDCVKGDMKSLGLSHEHAQDRNHWRLKIYGKPADPGLPVT